MKWSHKVEKLFRGESYARGWRRLQRRLHPVPVGPLLDRIDRDRLREIQQRYAGSHRQIRKYAEVEDWLKANIKRAQDLGLNRSASPLQVLDLGCGGGFFLAVCQQLGHHAIGIDLDEFPMYRELIDLLGVERQVWEIKPFEPLPDLGHKFDLITAFSIGFNRNPDKSLWGPREWEFFLNDLEMQQLAPGGRIFLALNPQGESGQFYTAELRNYFLRRGAAIDRERILLKPRPLT